MKKLLLILSSIILFTNCAEAENMSGKSNNDATEIEIIIGSEKAEGIVYDNSAGKSFLSLLPVTLKMSDYNSTEKISNIGSEIDTSGMPSSFDPNIADIAYYKPWGNLCLFYRDFGLSYGLYSIGKITNGTELFSMQKNDFEITIKRK